MEFHEKLQYLRRQKGLTQEEAAQQLFVSRAAVSKWESGRGYPNIDSLKAIAVLYDVSIDELLSGREMLTIAEEDKKHSSQMRDRLFGIMDCCGLLYLFLPLFAQRDYGMVWAVSLLELTNINGYMRFFYVAFVMAMSGLGVLGVMRPHVQCSVASLILSAVGVLLFSLSLQPYGVAFTFIFLMLKVFLLIKRK